MTSENPVGLSEKKSETSAVEDTGFDAPEAHHYSSEEKHLLRKIDWTLIPWVGFLYFLAVEDRVNVGFGMQEPVGLTKSTDT
jgi:hypothetical protein